MSLNGAWTDLSNGFKKVRLRWEEAREGWKDVVAHDFEANQWALLEQRVKAVLQAMDRMEPVLARARRECE
jgi:hypothetical protein